MICRSCNTQCPDDSKFCPVCGTPVESQPEAPAAGPVILDAPEVPAAPKAPAEAPKLTATAHQKTAAVILALLAVFALVLGVLNTFCITELPVSVSADLSVPMPNETGSSYTGIGGMLASKNVLELDGSIVVVDASIGLVSELLNTLDTYSQGVADASIGAGYAAMILFGLINLVIAAFGALYYLHIRTGKFGFFGFLGGRSPLVFVGLAGIVGAVAQILLMLTAGVSISQMGMSLAISVGVHWTTWLSLLLYGAVAGYELLRLDKNAE